MINLYFPHIIQTTFHLGSMLLMWQMGWCSSHSQSWLEVPRETLLFLRLLFSSGKECWRTRINVAFHLIFRTQYSIPVVTSSFGGQSLVLSRSGGCSLVLQNRVWQINSNRCVCVTERETERHRERQSSSFYFELQLSLQHKPRMYFIAFLFFFPYSTGFL